ncbi:hypothetical protein JCM1840_004865 [Sporobolomyces johnsonii]
MAKTRRPTIVPEPFNKPPVAHECLEGYSRPISWRNPLGLPAPLTWKQASPIPALSACATRATLGGCEGKGGLGGAFISGAINFGIACAMYRGAHRVTIWEIKHNTLAGDVGLTTLIQVRASAVLRFSHLLKLTQDPPFSSVQCIQGVLTFVIGAALVNCDMRKRKVNAFPYPWPDTQFAVIEGADPEAASTRRGKLWRTFHQRHGLGRGLHFFSGAHVHDVFNCNLTWKQFFVRLFWSALKGFILACIYWIVYWPCCIAVIAGAWDGHNLAPTWIPEIVKLIYGFLLGLGMTPLVAMLALGSEDSVRDYRREVHRENVREMEEAPPAMVTDAERVVRPRPVHFHD